MAALSPIEKHLFVILFVAAEIGRTPGQSAKTSVSLRFFYPLLLLFVAAELGRRPVGDRRL